MFRRIAVLVFSALFLAFSYASAGPEPAQKILDAALKESAASGRPVLVIFHATWCSWCKKLDGVLTTPEVKKIIDANYVVTHLDVMERGEKQQTVENPGGQEIMKKLGGEKSGLPFYAFLDASGKKLADSNVMPKSSNIGYPGAPEEITAFEQLLTKTAPKMTDAERADVMKHFSTASASTH